MRLKTDSEKTWCLLEDVEKMENLFQTEISYLRDNYCEQADQIVSLKKEIKILKDTLQEIADEDFRGNRSSASQKAFHALKKIKGANE